MRAPALASKFGGTAAGDRGCLSPSHLVTLKPGEEPDGGIAVGYEVEQGVQAAGLEDGPDRGADRAQDHLAPLLAEHAPDGDQLGEEDAVEALGRAGAQAEGQLAAAVLRDQADHL